jgi:hypothetical protein
LTQAPPSTRSSAHRRAARGHGVAAHGLQQRGALEGDALQRGARDVGHVLPRVRPVMVPRASGFQ